VLCVCVCVKTTSTACLGVVQKHRDFKKHEDYGKRRLNDASDAVSSAMDDYVDSLVDYTSGTKHCDTFMQTGALYVATASSVEVQNTSYLSVFRVKKRSIGTSKW